MVWRRFRQHRPALIGLVGIAIILLLATLVPLLTNYDALKTNVDFIRNAPSIDHIFGTDELGRDLIRLWAGADLAVDRGGDDGDRDRHRDAGRRGGRLLRRADRQRVDALHRFHAEHPAVVSAVVFAQLLRATNNPVLSGGPLPIITIIGIGWNADRPAGARAVPGPEDA